ncbi:uncharacterized protein LOC143283939 isoform X2 [Babylonia areolata]|uniref:uncharacterized protein LOC143283939 isoform X2 n=1 Tax=Babylonia areolata TaxID=304850 RepID=UPI003FD10C87
MAQGKERVGEVVLDNIATTPPLLRTSHDQRSSTNQQPCWSHGHKMATLICNPGQTTNLNMGLGKFETRLGDDVITNGFTEELKNYRDKADPADQLKCSELLASLRCGQDFHRQEATFRRPKTAMAALDIPDITHVTRPYETTYQREYVPRPDANVRAVRPMTSQGFMDTEKVPQALHLTCYDEEFHKKNQRPASPIRSGTASGARANKPHPTKSFMMWRFPGKTQPFPQSSPWSEELTNEKLNQVTKRLCRSTYQSDFLGIPQGFQVKSAYGNQLPGDWKERVPYTLHSFQRSTYRTPQQQQELLVPTNRYGSNSRKHLASTGVIPSANTRAMDIRSRTTYDRFYNDTAPDVASQARDVSRLLVADTIRLQHEKPFVQDESSNTCQRKGKKTSASPFGKKDEDKEPTVVVPPAKSLTGYHGLTPIFTTVHPLDDTCVVATPQRISDWPGPLID